MLIRGPIRGPMPGRRSVPVGVPPEDWGNEVNQLKAAVDDIEARHQKHQSVAKGAAQQKGGALLLEFMRRRFIF